MSAFRAIFVIAVLLGAACGSASAQQTAESAPPGPASPDAILIGPGDVLTISVFHVPELNLRIQTDAEGSVRLPLLGDMKFAGRTVREAQLLIEQRLIELSLVKFPQVSLLIETSATRGITVYGAVAEPGIYPLVGPHTLTEVIAAAGGLTDKAGRDVTVLRNGQTGRRETARLTGGTPGAEGNLSIYPGDTVMVSKAGVVYVTGEVNKAGAFLMEDNTSMSLLKAIALAQGTTKTASLKTAIVVRKSANGYVQLELPLDRITHGKSSDIPLQGDDVVFVPFSNLKYYGPMGLQGAIQAAVYTIYARQIK